MSRNLTLKIAFLEVGLSQRAVAETVGIHEVTLSRIVNGLACDDDTKQAIADALGRPVGQLWPGHGAASDQNPTGPNADRLNEAEAA